MQLTFLKAYIDTFIVSLILKTDIHAQAKSIDQRNSIYFSKKVFKYKRSFCTVLIYCTKIILVFSHGSYDAFWRAEAQSPSSALTPYAKGQNS